MSKYVVTYEYLSGADFAFHKSMVVTADVKATIIRLLDIDCGARSFSHSVQVNNISCDDCTEDT